MNVLRKMTIVIQMQRATIMLDHLVAHAILASLEMEATAKVCLNAQNYFSDGLYHNKPA